MSVPFLREAVEAGANDKLIRFVRLHLGDGNEEVGKREIDKSWIEAVKVLFKHHGQHRVFVAECGIRLRPARVSS
jgi:hypothetical protein